MAGLAIKIIGADYSECGLGKVHIKGSSVPITGIAIKGDGSVVDCRQFIAELTPSNTTQTEVIWSIVTGTQYATIDQNGLVTALDGAQAQLVKIKCASKENPNVYAEKNISVTKASSAELVTDGLIHNYDAHGIGSSPSIVDSVAGLTATFNGTTGQNCIEITSTLDGNTLSHVEWEKMLNGLSTWTLEYVLKAGGFANSVADIYHDVASKDTSGRVVVYLGPAESVDNGLVCVRKNGSWTNVPWDTKVSELIDWSVPHVIHVTREQAATGATFKLYVDGQYIATAASSNAYSGNTYSDGAVFLATKGQRTLYAIRAYNKALSANEVAQNFDFDNNRYDLNI